jgi:hypothetical protein
MDITVQELRQKLDSGEQFLLLDVREPWNTRNSMSVAN